MSSQRVQLGPFFSGGQLQTNAKLYHYEAGQSTVRHVWADKEQEIQLTNPIISDQNGVFNFFADGNYKIVIAKSGSTGPTDQALYTLDNWSFLDQAETALQGGGSVSAASTITIGPELVTHVVGSATIGALDSDLPFFWLIFDGSLTMTHSAVLMLPGSRNRKMLANDVAFFTREDEGIFRMAGHLESEGGYLSRMGAGQAAAAQLSIPTDGDFVEVTGSDIDISSIATASAGYKMTVRVSGSGVQFLHSASLIMPYSQDYRCVTNEVLEFRSLGSGAWVLAYRSGPTAPPASLLDGMFTAADDGYVLPIGTALVCTRYASLAKRCIPAASVLGTSGTSLGTPTFSSGTDLWSLAAHGLVNGDIVHLTNSGGALPTGYTVNTVYYVVNAATNTFQLSTSRGGSVVDGTTNGTGTQTVHNKFQIPDVRGYAKVGRDNLGGSAANVITSSSTNGANAQSLGGKFGAQTHQLVIGEIPSHQHQILTVGDTVGAGGSIPAVYDVSPASPSLTETAGSGGAHSNTQPSIAVGCQLRW
jgi:hypothetical protein